MKWISVNDKMPEPIEVFQNYYTIRVIACWGNNPDEVAEMHYVRELVKGKFVERWKRNGFLLPSGWKIKAWMPVPEPPKNDFRSCRCCIDGMI